MNQPKGTWACNKQSVSGLGGDTTGTTSDSGEVDGIRMIWSATGCVLPDVERKLL